MIGLYIRRVSIHHIRLATQDSLSLNDGKLNEIRSISKLSVHWAIATWLRANLLGTYWADDADALLNNRCIFNYSNAKKSWLTVNYSLNESYPNDHIFSFYEKYNLKKNKQQPSFSLFI